MSPQKKEVPLVPKPINPVEKIDVLEMKRRTSLGVNLKSLQRFEMREDDNNFRNLRKYLGTLDLEIINEEIIDVIACTNYSSCRAVVTEAVGAGEGSARLHFRKRTVGHPPGQAGGPVPGAERDAPRGGKVPAGAGRGGQAERENQHSDLLSAVPREGRGKGS